MASNNSSQLKVPGLPGLGPTVADSTLVLDGFASKSFLCCARRKCDSSSRPKSCIWARPPTRATPRGTRKGRPRSGEPTRTEGSSPAPTREQEGRWGLQRVCWKVTPNKVSPLLFACRAPTWSQLASCAIPDLAPCPRAFTQKTAVFASSRLVRASPCFQE